MINSDGKSRPVLNDPPEVLTILIDLRLRAFARTPYDRLITDIGTVDAAERAMSEGCDAIYIDTFADYGIDAVRAVFEVPVVGAGEASLAAAAAHGAFSIVTVWPRSMRYLYDERLLASPAGVQCLGVHHFSAEDELELAGGPGGIKARMTRSEPDLIDQLADACRAAHESDGSDAVLLGCTCMSPVAEQLQERCSFPVLDPSAIGQQAAFDALSSGTVTRRWQPTPRLGDVGRLVDAWQMSQGNFIEDDCPTCVFVPTTLD